MRRVEPCGLTDVESVRAMSQNEEYAPLGSFGSFLVLLKFLVLHMYTLYILET